MAAGIVVTACALAPPVDAFGDGHLVAHMAQHVTLTAIAAPLLAVAAGDRWRSRPWPAAAAVAQVSMLWWWHMPAPFLAAVHHPALHALEHVTLLASATAFWMSVVALARGRQLGAGAVAVMPVAIAGTMLGAVITLWPRHLYGVPLDTQQVAGVVMWAVGGTVNIITLTLLFAGWLRRQDGARQP